MGSLKSANANWPRGSACAEDKFQYLYLLTPKGIAAKLRMTRAYLARKEPVYEALQAERDADERSLFVLRADGSVTGATCPAGAAMPRSRSLAPASAAYGVGADPVVLRPLLAARAGFEEVRTGTP